ncbi:hypothetical protein DGo_PC0264 (plasmid) [Deinococcus gobiensis I-0]|uniref:Uncharacterized protein n=1 Tax=Deinococcus gobiensis (strain DSM 21396 / JCM 16679 / CGMCC 1.7299 / I-0) TaxID=745776 RepID=H8H3F9_DEIGI|nr:hypothetical protein DGo_PC0264 [Deinococcus gobiensis I-0]
MFLAVLVIALSLLFTRGLYPPDPPEAARTTHVPTRNAPTLDLRVTQPIPGEQA